MSRQWYLIGYDVCDSKRLRKTAKIMESYGYRIQFSFFRVQASDRQIERMRWELSQILEPEDHLLIIRLCHSCAENVEEQSETIRWETDPPCFQIIGGHFKE